MKLPLPNKVVKSLKAYWKAQPTVAFGVITVVALAGYVIVFGAKATNTLIDNPRIIHLVSGQQVQLGQSLDSLPEASIPGEGLRKLWDTTLGVDPEYVADSNGVQNLAIVTGTFEGQPAITGFIWNSSNFHDFLRRGVFPGMPTTDLIIAYPSVVLDQTGKLGLDRPSLVLVGIDYKAFFPIQQCGPRANLNITDVIVVLNGTDALDKIKSKINGFAPTDCSQNE